MKKLFIVSFILIPCIITVVIFALPDKMVSEKEKRNLKTLDSISVSALSDDVESYLSDQFPIRENIVAAKTRLFYMLGKRDINGCYICKDRLVQKITDKDVDCERLFKYADKINAFAENIDTTVIYIPSAEITLSNELPANAEVYDFDKLYNDLSARLSNATLIDVKNFLSSNDSYYLTDHHWTAKGAYAVYQEWCKTNSINPQNFEFKDVTNEFYGTLYSKALIAKFPSDTITAPLISNNITVNADGAEIEFYDKTALDTADKYNYFQGGNHGILTVENENVKNGKVLLILKDSFANSFLPYLINDYEKIIMLDERYSFISPSDLIEKENVNHILVLKEIIS